jgi:hypothetical protein
VPRARVYTMFLYNCIFCECIISLFDCIRTCLIKYTRTKQVKYRRKYKSCKYKRKPEWILHDCYLRVKERKQTINNETKLYERNAPKKRRKTSLVSPKFTNVYLMFRWIPHIKENNVPWQHSLMKMCERFWAPRLRKCWKIHAADSSARHVTCALFNEQYHVQE